MSQSTVTAPVPTTAPPPASAPALVAASACATASAPALLPTPPSPAVAACAPPVPRPGSPTTARTAATARRYRPFPPVGLTDRTWPDRTLSRPPRWLSTDLRDGNQSLAEPMSIERKLRMFNLLVAMGYREIEVGYPAASEPDHAFVRLLVERDLVPDEVTISVLTPARADLIEKSVRSLRGARRATVHLYNATAPFFRQVVLGVDREGCRKLAVHGAEEVLRYAERYGLADCLGFEYSPEVFVDTELDFALETCAAVMDVWQPAAGREIIVNLPATVERATPNVFADQVEWMSRHLPYREHTCLSVHPHNDRGTAVAAAELAVLAGAQRVEGCLFGNGERAGNVCLVTLALNLLSQGVDPGVDFSDIETVRRTVEECNQLPVHPRHPYGGRLLHTAFSGSHQDAINKGFAEMARTAHRTGADVDELPWTMPYLPVDPRDLGRTYEGVIRVNSQSGKGGVAYLMRTEFGLELPRGVQVEFSRRIQAHAETDGGEVRPAQLWRDFVAEYLADVPLRLLGLCRVADGAGTAVTVELGLAGFERALRGGGADSARATAAALAALGPSVRVQELLVHRRARPAAGGYAAFVRCLVDGRSTWGVGLADDGTAAPVRAVLGAVNRAVCRPVACSG
jgi:2-isopropylmalate synthase